LWPGILLLLKAKNIPVGKRVGEWVYELFITTLDAEGFLVEDVLDLYHGRGAFEAVLADEDVEEDPDRWCSYTECGQELWQMACQWVWNLRLSLGETMQGVQVREIEWAPPKEAPAVFGAYEPSPEEYGPWQWAAAFGRATGRFGAEDFVLQEDGKLRCPAGASLNFGRSASRECLYESWPSTWPTRRIVNPVLCESSVWHQEPRGIEPVALVRSVVSCLHPHLCLLSASRSCSDRSGGWMWLSEHFAAPG
jgi:hypothetical protein